MEVKHDQQLAKRAMNCPEANWYVKTLGIFIGSPFFFGNSSGFRQFDESFD